MFNPVPACHAYHRKLSSRIERRIEIKTHIKRKYKEVWRQQTHSKYPQDPSAD
uniref:Uncharacterized protein n=1 Tax=Arion vulgaris TaxID=1028688 RepID=A0A0B7BCZ0_9EUPU